MKFGDAIKSFFKNYANFNGRARRSAYWFALLFATLVNMACNIINPGQTDRSSTLGGLWSLAVLLPGLAIAVRRLHDTGRSAKYLLWLLLPIVGWIILAVYLAEEGKSESNEFGEPVK
jgi:uncharacterized membrane protein YhaH (DUF805 family)